ncbi:hypothetical protein PsorP6_001414 [Peronosclerospora sorghi]|uniref:Uncharacterized protein n=1 Tax=Peronosclerospora sorghi TaxID=230839 RepID=A0ACC0WSX4_9STRA|nr:hypothetical protein PsorP6_001414 [Peronosclerospora sorghi]
MSRQGRITKSTPKRQITGTVMVGHSKSAPNSRQTSANPANCLRHLAIYSFLAWPSLPTLNTKVHFQRQISFLSPNMFNRNDLSPLRGLFIVYVQIANHSLKVACMI